MLAGGLSGMVGSIRGVDAAIIVVVFVIAVCITVNNISAHIRDARIARHTGRDPLREDSEGPA